MKRTAFAAFGLFIMFAASAPLSAKGITTTIRIQGADLAAPIEIREPDIVKRFSVWAGAGTRVNGKEQTEGFIIDWPSGVVPDRSNGLRRYEVSFYVKFWNRASQRYDGNEQLAYVVFYDWDRSADRGYVYLPGPADEQYRLNTRAILRGRGREGHWLRAASTWQQVVTPLLARARGEPQAVP